MLHRQVLTILVGALVVAVSPLAVRPAQGQSAGGYYYETSLYGYNPGYYARRYAVRPILVLPRKEAPSSMPYVYYLPTPAAAPANSTRTPPVDVRIRYGAVTPALADAAAHIELQVPTDAQVWFGGQQTTQTGALRHYASPTLISGREYTYEVRVAWKEGGREVTESRRLSIRAGDRLSASFPAAGKLTAGKDASALR
jgi:uncharacterized protein (TIGR03000 family)